jgi:hypothetical protein
LLCSIALCCPVVSMLGVLFGIRAIVEIRANPSIAGRGLAKSGIIIGLTVCVMWVAGLIWWHFNARQPMMNGPVAELRAGFDDDMPTFKAGFTAAGESVPDAEARQFIAALRTRYGGFRDSAMSVTSQNQAPLTGRPVLRISYTLQFDRGPVEAEAAFVTFGETQSIVPKLVFQWEWIRIIDATQGDLVYPESARAEALAPPATQPQIQVATQPSS